MHRLSSCGSWAYLLCSMWNLLEQGSNPCLLHWQVDSLPLSHQGSPTITLGAEGIRMNKTRNTAKEVARGGEGVLGAGGNKCLMDLVFVFCGEIHLHKINRNYF